MMNQEDSISVRSSYTSKEASLSTKRKSFLPKFNTSGAMSSLSDESDMIQHDEGRSNSFTSASENTTIYSKSSDRQESMNFQHLDEILEELITPPKEPLTQNKPRGSFESYDTSSSSENEERIMKVSSRDSLGRKAMSWIPRRNTSPIPVPGESGALGVAESPIDPHGTVESSNIISPTYKKVSRSRSQIISLLDGNAPPLPYNFKSKKKVAKRIQSIHQIVEKSEPSSIQIESFPTSATAMDSPLKSSIAICTDDDTTISSGSGSLVDSQHRFSSSETVDSRNRSGSTTPVRQHVKFVPYRMQDSTVDLSNLTKPLTTREQIRLATLLSAQEAQFGFNMFDAMIPNDKDQINNLMKLGYHYEDAVLAIFEKRYVRNTSEQRVHSAPVSPNVSFDYSARPNAAETPNYSADYAFSTGLYYPPQNILRGSSPVPVGYASPLPGQYTGYSYPIAYLPGTPASTLYSSPPPAPPAGGLPPKSPKNTPISTAGRKEKQPVRTGSSAASSRSNSRSPLPGSTKRSDKYAVPTAARLAAHNA